jgi:hypothetical protein
MGNVAMLEFDWRSPEAYAKMQAAEAPDLAWEYLRRNNEYRRDFADQLKRGSIHSVDRRFRQRWGLSFRR